MSDSVKAWDRSPLDTDIGWTMFQEHRDTPPSMRPEFSVSARALASKYNLHLQEVYNIALNAMWKERIRAYDRAQARAACRIPIADTRVPAARHTELARACGETAAIEARRLLYEAREGRSRLRPADVLRLGEFALKWERLIAGQATEHVQHSLESLTTEELQTLLELEKKAGCV